MNTLLIFVTAITSLNIYAAGTGDAFLTRAGWVKQSGGWMDPETKLVWGTETEKMSWGEAKSFCQSLKLEGKNWRLPTVHELQNSVCKKTGYKTRTSCPEPKDHTKDMSLLIEDKEATLWASDLIPGDPYHAYYFMLDVEGQHIMTSKGDKSKAMCVTEGNAPAATIAAAPAEPAKPTEVKQEAEHNFYIAPLIGFGGFFTAEMGMNNYPFFNAELRLGFRMSDDMFLYSAVDTGVNIKEFSYPMFTTITVGPEYFASERVSILVAAGLSVLTTRQIIFVGQPEVRDTSAGFAWKAGVTVLAAKWGGSDQYNFPISLTYTGTKTRLVLCHTVLVSFGFMYF
ncbi:MAG: DUF1566 domain-containing protein [Pseudomonadota bacterium]